MIPFLRPNVDLSTLGRRLNGLREERYSNFGPNEERYCAEMQDAFFSPDHHVVATSNATVALSTALLMLDEAFHRASAEVVLCPSFTFSATGLAAKYLGKRIILYDLTREFQPDIEQITACLDQLKGQPVSVILYEVFGQQIDPGIIADLVGRGQPLVIDAAASLALPSNHKRPLPMTVQVFSTHVTKPFATIEGGLIVANTSEFELGQIRSFINFGFRGARSAEVVGTNGKMGELHALVGLETLERFPVRMRVYHGLAAKYRELLEDLLHPAASFGHEPAYQFFPALLAEHIDPKCAFQALNGQDVFGFARHFSPPLHVQPVFRDAELAGPMTGTEWLAERVVSLPLYSRLSESDVEKIAATFLETAKFRQAA